MGVIGIELRMATVKKEIVNGDHDNEEEDEEDDDDREDDDDKRRRRIEDEGIHDDLIDAIARGKEIEKRDEGSPIDEYDSIVLREQDRFLPICNISRIMKKMIPGSGKISKESKETVQEAVSEFISFITSEASDKCIDEKRKTITADDLLNAIEVLGFDRYVEPLKIFLERFREATKSGDRIFDIEGEGGNNMNNGEDEGDPSLSTNNTPSISSTPLTTNNVPITTAPPTVSSSDTQRTMVPIRFNLPSGVQQPNIILKTTPKSLSGEMTSSSSSIYVSGGPSSSVVTSSSRRISTVHTNTSNIGGVSTIHNNHSNHPQQMMIPTTNDPSTSSTSTNGMVSTSSGTVGTSTVSGGDTVGGSGRSITVPPNVESLQPVQVFVDPTTGQHYIMNSDPSGTPSYQPIQPINIGHQMRGRIKQPTRGHRSMGTVVCPPTTSTVSSSSSSTRVLHHMSHPHSSSSSIDDPSISSHPSTSSIPPPPPPPSSSTVLHHIPPPPSSSTTNYIQVIPHGMQLHPLPQQSGSNYQQHGQQMILIPSDGSSKTIKRSSGGGGINPSSNQSSNTNTNSKRRRGTSGGNNEI